MRDSSPELGLAMLVEMSGDIDEVIRQITSQQRSLGSPRSRKKVTDDMDE